MYSSLGKVSNVVYIFVMYLNMYNIYTCMIYLCNVYIYIFILLDWNLNLSTIQNLNLNENVYAKMSQTQPPFVQGRFVFSVAAV